MKIKLGFPLLHECPSEFPSIHSWCSSSSTSFPFFHHFLLYWSYPSPYLLPANHPINTFDPTWPHLQPSICGHLSIPCLPSEWKLQVSCRIISQVHWSTLLRSVHACTWWWLASVKSSNTLGHMPHNQLCAIHARVKYVSIPSISEIMK